MSKFKVGDTVKIIGNSVIEHLFPVGSSGSIIEVISSDSYSVRVPKVSYLQTIHEEDLEIKVSYVIEENGELYIVSYIPDDADRVWELGRELTKEIKWS